MSNDESFRAPAGWYPDPLGHPQLRWWNGNGWTEQISAAPEPLVMQEARYAWKEDEPPLVVAPVVATPAVVIPVAPAPVVAASVAPVGDRTPPPPVPPVASTLNQLEAPRQQQKVDEPSGYTKYTESNWKAPVGAEAIVTSLTEPVPGQTALPSSWDDDDMWVPTPSVNPADLKFWSGPNPAELRRLRREEAARGPEN